jgi:hypothetical protein
MCDMHGEQHQVVEITLPAHRRHDLLLTLPASSSTSSKRRILRVISTCVLAIAAATACLSIWGMRARATDTSLMSRRWPLPTNLDAKSSGNNNRKRSEAKLERLLSHGSIGQDSSSRSRPKQEAEKATLQLNVHLHQSETNKRTLGTQGSQAVIQEGSAMRSGNAAAGGRRGAEADNSIRQSLHNSKARSRTQILSDWIGGSKVAEHTHPRIVAKSASSQLWDFPDIVKYQYSTSRESFWPTVQSYKPVTTADGRIEWPDTSTSSSGLMWPTTTVGGGAGDSQEGHSQPHKMKAGALLRRGDIMPVTRPWVQW